MTTLTREVGSLLIAIIDGDEQAELALSDYLTEVGIDETVIDLMIRAFVALRGTDNGDRWIIEMTERIEANLP